MKAAEYLGNRTFKVTEGSRLPPEADEVRLDVAYCGICGTDVHIYHGAMDHRVRVPQVIGHEMSGVVSEVGSSVSNFSVGDQVVVRPLDDRSVSAAQRVASHIPDGMKFMGIDTPGAFQSSWTVPASTLHKLPADIDMQKAAMIEPLAVACHDVRRGRVAPGEHVVVLGGGPIGMLVALTARGAGAKVLLSEVNRSRIEIASELGLEAMNPVEQDGVARVGEWTGGHGADIIFEVSGAPAAVRQMTELAAIRGRIVMVAIHPKPVEVDLFRFFWREIEMLGARTYEAEDYEQAINLVAGDALPLAKLITGVEPIDQLPQAFERLDADPRAMKVLIDCQA